MKLLSALFLLLPAIWVVPNGEYFNEANLTGNGQLLHYQQSGWELVFPNANVAAGDFIEADFSFQADTKNAPLHYVLEVKEAEQWLVADTLKATMEQPANGEFATYLRTYRKRQSADTLRLRLRGLEPASERVRFAHQSNVGIYVNNLGSAIPKDTLRVLCIGNSFTYVYQAPYQLKQLAWSQGHYLDVEAALRGGYTFGNHLHMQGTDEAIRRGGYDYVFLQNQSQTNAWYGQDPEKNKQIADDAKELVRRIREFSPEAQIVIESTWAYPGLNYGDFGNYATYDQLMELGSELIAQATNGRVSYINRGFIAARQLGAEALLYGGDQKHQSALGSYLKACVNYSILYGKPLPKKIKARKGNKANADLWFDTQEAALMRVASRGKK